MSKPHPKPETNDKGQSLQLVVDNDGNEIMCKEIRPGTWAGVESGKIVRNYNPHFSIPGKALEARETGLEKQKEKRKQGILEAVRTAGYNAQDIFDADGYVHEILTGEVVMNMEVPARDRIKGMETLWKSAGLLSEKNKENEGITIHANMEALELLMVNNLFPDDPEKQIEKLKEIRNG